MLKYRYSCICLVTFLAIAFNPKTLADSGSTLEQAINQFEDKISVVESQEGPYSERLSQQLVQLAVLFQQQNKHQHAVKQLTRALHLTRVNEGLYSPSQIDVLEQLIVSQKALKKWKLVNNHMAYAYWLHTMNYAENTAQMIDITLKVANWSLKAYTLRINEKPIDDLLTAHESFKRLSHLTSKEYGQHSLKVLDALHGQMISNYLIGVSDPSQDGPADSLVYHEVSSMDMLRVQSFQRGLKIINQEIEILLAQAKVNHMQVVDAMLKLADWNLMYGRPQSATKQYKRAYQYVQENDKENQAYTNLFAKPVALPKFPKLALTSRERLTKQDIAANKKYVLASFNVTRLGRVKQVKVLSANSEIKSATQNRIVRRLRYATFRPQLNLGSPVLTEEAQLHVYVD